MSSARTYQLPGTQEYTSDVKAYLAAWEALIAKVLPFFPGYEPMGFDPALQLQKWALNGLGALVVVDRITLSTEAIGVLQAPTKESIAGANKQIKRLMGRNRKPRARRTA